GLTMNLREHVGALLDVADCQPLVDILGIELLAGEALQLIVVVVRSQDRLLEDRGVRGHAAQRLLRDHAGKLAALDQRPADLAEPNAHARLGERLQAWIDLGCCRHAYQASLTRATTSRAVIAT